TARATIPAWAQRAYNFGANQNGPMVSTTYPFGRYLEDNAYLGDLTNSVTGQPFRQGVDFDLNEWNVRWCVTPEFPAGTFAYFVCITSSGAPAFPYNIGRAFFGTPAGNAVANITEMVTTNFVGGANTTLRLSTPVLSNSVVTLIWSATEGGAYRVESTANFSGWTTNAQNISA